MVSATLAAAAAALFGPAIGIAVMLLPLLAMVASPLLRYLPRGGYGWLYLSLIVVVSVAPSLGSLGTLLRFVGAAAVVAALVHSTINDHRSYRPTRAPSVFTVLILVLVLVLALAAMSAPSIGFGVNRFLGWAMFIPVAFLIIRRPDWRGIGSGMVVAATIQMVAVALQAAGLLGGTWGGLLLYGTGYDPSLGNWLTRYTGFVLDPNNLAIILTLGIIVICALLISRPPRSAAVVLLLLAAIFAAGVFLSGSRGGILAGFIGIAVLLALHGLRGLFAGLVLIGAGVFLAGVVRWDEASRVLNSISDIWTGTDQSADFRVNLWARYLGENSPVDYVLGKGFGGYAPELFAGAAFDSDTAALRAATIDNAWLKMLLESGALGVASVAAIMVFAFVSGASARGPARPMGITAAAMLVAILFRSLSVDALDISPWNGVLWVLIGACVVARRNGRESPGRVDPSNRRNDHERMKQ